jgi:hypothetical protein
MQQLSLTDIGPLIQEPIAPSKLPDQIERRGDPVKGANGRI